LPSSGAAALERFATGPGRYVMKSTLYQISSYHNPVISIYGLLKNCVIQKRERGRERDRVKARERERAKERERGPAKKSFPANQLSSMQQQLGPRVSRVASEIN
jgi:hypothetical protein